MSALDWILFLGFLAYVVWDGSRRARHNRDAADYFLAGRSVVWWAMGLSIMATQASAITMIGTTGKGWQDGMRFVQFYFALPIAMVILAYTLVPAFHRLKLFTAYEYLEVRFDRKTRVIGALLFLILRGLSAGFLIYAPGVVLAAILGLPEMATIPIMGLVATVYTMVGGMRAVVATDIKQMLVMWAGLIVAFFAILNALPQGVGLTGAFELAEAAGRLETIVLRWDPSDKYTLWSGLLGGLFLFLAYFGADQSQVQRHLSGRSLRDKRAALLMNAVLKVPFQAFVLTVGVMLFVFTIFQPTPVSYIPAEAPSAEIQATHQRARTEVRARAESLLQADSPEAREQFRESLASSEQIRARARAARGGRDDVNYVFPWFILEHLPLGLAGILLAAILAAALSSVDSELLALTTVTAIDLARLPHEEVEHSETLLRRSRWMTLLWGAFATAFALYAGALGSVIDAVNQVGSYFYGSLLGVFILGFASKRANGHGATAGLILGMATVLSVTLLTDLGFLWWNTLGTFAAVAGGWLVSLATRQATIPAEVKP